MPASPDLRAEISKAWRLATAPLRMLPSFIIAGAPKCGTSTLYDMIATHPQVRRAVRKEPTNFIHYPGSRFRSAMNYPPRMLNRGAITGEGSVEYFTHPDAPRNVRDIVPRARLIFLFRNPVQRAWSDYQMFRKHGTEQVDFVERIARAIEWLTNPSLAPLVEAASCHAFNPVRYVAAGMYYKHLQRWLEHFPREQCLVLIYEEFFHSLPSASAQVLRHLRLPGEHLAEVPTARRGGYGESIAAAPAQMLRDFYRAENEKLAEYLGRAVPW